MTSLIAQALNKKHIVLNNLGGKYSLVMKFAQFMSYRKRKNFNKNSTKTATWKLVPGSFVFAKN